MIEQFTCSEAGYSPLLIRKGWQVALLTYVEGQGLFEIKKMDVHFQTDEAFLLLQGTAVLIVTDDPTRMEQYRYIKMHEGNIYNIPVNNWHNIAMCRDAKVAIIEKDYTHLGDYKYHYLNETEIEQLNATIQSVL